MTAGSVTRARPALPRPSARAVDRALVAAAVAYWVVVAVDVILRRDTGLIHAAALGSSPASVANGEVERLLSSGLVVEGALPGLQVAVAAALTTLVVHRHGPRAWWGAALSGHVGSALVAYGFIAAAVGAGLTPDRIQDQSDYGISAVLAATAGALFAGSVRRLRRGGTRADLLVAVACLAGVAAVVPLSLNWYGLEHPLAFALGAGFLAAYERRAARPAD